MTEAQLRAAIQSAIERLRREEPPLDFRRAHERSISQRLAIHLEPFFRQEWNVDCEYDRDGQLKKLLEGIKGCDAEKKTNAIFPDIIVHHREQPGRAHNLLVIELKKDAAEDPCDRRKLELLTDPAGHYQYQMGLYINVDGGIFGCTWYRDGRQVE
jgi:hypothetical protein